jgi:hypothetical protein
MIDKIITPVDHWCRGKGCQIELEHGEYEDIE